MRDHLPRIAGAVLFVAGFILLVTSPPREQFNALRLYFSLGCFVAGYLLVLGLIGTDPVAARVRREPPAAARAGPLCPVEEQIFPYTATPGRRALAVGSGIALALPLLFGAGWVFRAIPGSPLDRATAAFPLFLGAAVCGWCPVRWSGMYVKASRQGLTARLYFRTVSLRWEDVEVLVARERRTPTLVLSIPLLVPLETVYTVYSRDSMLYFTARLPGKDRLAALIAEATGLRWQ